MKLTDEMSILERTTIIEEALIQLLDRDETMIVEPWGQDGPHVYVLEAPFSDSRRAHDIGKMARELEVMLS